jgi:hypothetical protein
MLQSLKRFSTLALFFLVISSVNSLRRHQKAANEVPKKYARGGAHLMKWKCDETLKSEKESKRWKVITTMLCPQTPSKHKWAAPRTMQNSLLIKIANPSW